MLKELSLKYLIRKAENNIQKPKLMLLLHGYGSNEEDLFSFAEELPKEFCVISVRAPKNLPFGGYAWYDINFTDAKKFNDTKQAKDSIQKIREFIDEVISEYDLNSDEVWLCGFSQGAILSYALTLQNPQNIKKVICLSGYPAPDIIGDSISSNFPADLSFFISHGIQDAVIPIAWAEGAKTLLNSHKINHVYKEYNSGHGIVPQNFYDMQKWILENQKTDTNN